MKANPYTIKCKCGEHCVRKAGDTCSWCKSKSGTYRKRPARRKVYVMPGE
jgi:hypothetical protein